MNLLIEKLVGGECGRSAPPGSIIYTYIQCKNSKNSKNSTYSREIK